MIAAAFSYSPFLSSVCACSRTPVPASVGRRLGPGRESDQRDDDQRACRMTSMSCLEFVVFGMAGPGEGSGIVKSGSPPSQALPTSISGGQASRSQPWGGWFFLCARQRFEEVHQEDRRPGRLGRFAGSMLGIQRVVNRKSDRSAMEECWGEPRRIERRPGASPGRQPASDCQSVRNACFEPCSSAE